MATQQINPARQRMLDDSRRLGHPDPENATPGEVNILGLQFERFGRALRPEEAARCLELAERECDFNDNFRDVPSWSW